MKRSPPPWGARRASKIQSAVTDAINLERNEGIRIGRAIKLTARRYNGRSLGDGHHLRLSRKTLERLYYKWEAAGRDPQVFELHYKSGAQKSADPLLIRAVAVYCITHLVSVAEALRKLNLLSSVSVHAFYRALPVERICTYLRSARESVRREGRAGRELARLKTQILAAI